MKKYPYEVRIIRESSVGCMPCATLKDANTYAKENAQDNEYKILHNGKIITWKGKTLNTNTGIWE